MLRQLTPLLVLTQHDSVEEYVDSNPNIRDSLLRAVANSPEPISLGDALFYKILSECINEPLPWRPDNYLNSCFVRDIGYVPIPLGDSRWGSIDPVPDIYSTAQGTILKCLCENSLDAVFLGQRMLFDMATDFPFNLESSDTLIEYRKLSEILMQIHYCVIIQTLAGNGQGVDLYQLCNESFQYTIDSEYSKIFMTALFRSYVMQNIDEFVFAEPTWTNDELVESVMRLYCEPGFLEYRNEDKIDERSKSKSRSQRDQISLWTYSTAYGLLLLKKSGADESEVIEICERFLIEKLLVWPDLEMEMSIKEFDNNIDRLYTPYSMYVTIASLSH